MNEKTEFDSAFCNVKYIKDDNIVFLTWKQFARLNDYREPTTFALELLKKFPHSNFIVDALNGFDDEEADAKWVKTKWLPAMAKTDCEYAVFIVANADKLNDEMSMWAKEFGKYFAVVNVSSYDEAVKSINTRMLVNVKYTVKPGKRDEFLEKVIENKIMKASREEPGNAKYEYFKPLDSDDVLFLMEMWVNTKAQALHGKTSHFEKLQALKQEYVSDVSIEKFIINKI